MSSNLNSILIEGNLVREPELKATPKGTPVCVFSVASNRYIKQDEGFDKEVSFFDIESWNVLAKTCGESLHKGRGVRVVGRLKQDRWTGNDGHPYSKIKIVAEHVEMKPDIRNLEEEKQEKTSAKTSFLESAQEERKGGKTIQQMPEIQAKVKETAVSF